MGACSGEGSWDMRSLKNDLLGDLQVEVRRAMRTAVRREAAAAANEAIDRAMARITPSVRREVDRAIVKTLDWAVSRLTDAVVRKGR
jgi:hypothetical protein